jgi:hypothetical protein
LLLVTIVLVLIAAVTLLIGIFSDNLALIFISIGASALAAIVLAVLSQMSRRRGRTTSVATGPEPLPARTPEPAATPSPAATAPASVPAATAAPPLDAPVAAEPPTSVLPAVSAGELPIAGYDELRVNEILPKLDDLDLDQLELVAQHEEDNKNRTTVLNRIDQLMDELEAEEAETGAPAVVATADRAAIDDAAAATIETVGEPVVAVAGGDDDFPIDDYDSLSEDEVIELLEDLDADELETVADREEAGRNRDAVLDAIDDRLDILEGIVPAPAPAKKAPAKKAPAKKAPAKKAAAKKAAAKKAPPVATRSTRTAVPSKTAAKRVATPTKRAAAPTKKASSAASKKAGTVKKAAPVKKATAAKKAAKR